MKKKRLEKILELISGHEINTQEALAEQLTAAGFSVTQATVSRDIRELGLIKIVDKGGVYRYALAAEAPVDIFDSIFADSINNVDFAGNMVVLKCGVGMAQAVCTTIDKLEFDEIVGTLAGDDTVFILTRCEDSAAKLVKRLSK